MASAAVARELIVELRHKIARIEGRLAERFDDEALAAHDPVPTRAGGLLRTGAESFDTALGGGLPATGLVEIHGEASRDAGVAAGFTLGLCRLLGTPRVEAPLLWIATSDAFREAGRPYAPGLVSRFGFSASSLLLAEAERLADVLWIAEEAARLDAFQAVLLEIRGAPKQLDLTATQRLHRRALAAGRPFFLIRAPGEPEPTAAPVRLVVAPAPAAPRVTLTGPLAGSIGPPAFQVTISKSRTPNLAAFTLEWNHDTFQDRRKRTAENPVAVVPLSAGRQAAQAAPRQVVAFPEAGGGSASGVQPPRKQHPARRRARRAG